MTSDWRLSATGRRSEVQTGSTELPMQQPTTPRRFTNSWGRLVVDPELETSSIPAVHVLWNTNDGRRGLTENNLARGGGGKCPLHFGSCLPSLSFPPFPRLPRVDEAGWSRSWRSQLETVACFGKRIGRSQLGRRPACHSYYTVPRTILRMLLHLALC
jgi:hypothetical protein